MQEDEFPYNKWEKVFANFWALTDKEPEHFIGNFLQSTGYVEQNAIAASPSKLVVWEQSLAHTSFKVNLFQPRFFQKKRSKMNTISTMITQVYVEAFNLKKPNDVRIFEKWENWLLLSINAFSFIIQKGNGYPT